MEIVNSVWVRMAKAINRLVGVSNDCRVAALRKLVDYLLLRPIQVLILINNHVVKFRKGERQWVIAKIAQSFRNKLTDQHCLMESQPVT